MTEKYKKSKSFGIGCIILIVILIILLFAGVVLFKQRRNVKAIYGAATSSSEEIRQRQETNEKKTHEILDDITDREINELSEDMREKLKNGEISDDEALNVILGIDDAETVQTSANPEQSGDSNASDASVNSENVASNEKGDGENESVVTERDDSSDEKQSVGRKEKIIAEIYLLRAEYLNKIDALISSARTAYYSVPAEELTLSKKLSLLNTYKAKGSSLESDCDARMEALLDELRVELVNLNESTESISEIRSVYNEQKHLKKEELINMYYPK